MERRKKERYFLRKPINKYLLRFFYILHCDKTWSLLSRNVQSEGPRYGFLSSTISDSVQLKWQLVPQFGRKSVVYGKRN